jgi:hypothetical protein
MFLTNIFLFIIGLIICSLVNLATLFIPLFKYSNVKLLSTFSLKSKEVKTLFIFILLYY